MMHDDPHVRADVDDAWLAQHWSSPARATLGELVAWLDGELVDVADCADCARSAEDKDAWPPTCWEHWLLRQLERAEGKWHNANAVSWWARAVAIVHADVELWSEATEFGNAYARAVCAHWQASQA